ncbi:MAG: hypothetical protein WC091_16395 [Sulfuricellaceae bacterium]
MLIPRKIREEKRLLQLYASLSAEQQETARAFMEFLASRQPAVEEKTVSETPLPIPRPATESVVKALKRLRATYPMLDPDKLLHEASSHMQQHLLQGKPAATVIDELEILFARHYEAYRSED